ncbi:longitudinals lacking protein, isoforms F/I/K/T-like [Apis florea]|uniref:longitudinals lacking protein, isoforms F/I/K/T-like n=1 Tax=Apis florea TaxID=7463 RepID=UPI000252C602|nr:longitudinals lacking protein, isoforms F/I/K/T-like [Apis florea]
MVALLSLLRSDCKQQQSQPQQQQQQQQQQQHASKKTRPSSSSTSTTTTTRGGIVLASRRVSNTWDSNSYDSGNDNGGGARASTREVVFPDSFEVLPQPCDLSVVYMGVPHEQQRKFRCQFCGKGYRWKSTMRRHEMVECGGKPPAFQCPMCPYKARQRGNLTVHYKRHHQKIEYDEAA